MAPTRSSGSTGGRTAGGGCGRSLIDSRRGSTTVTTCSPISTTTTRATRSRTRSGSLAVWRRGPPLLSRRDVGQGDAVLFVEVGLTEDRLALCLDDRRPSHQKTVARSQPDVADLGSVHVAGQVLLEVELDGGYGDALDLDDVGADDRRLRGRVVRPVGVGARPGGDCSRRVDVGPDVDTAAVELVLLGLTEELVMRRVRAQAQRGSVDAHVPVVESLLDRRPAHVDAATGRRQRRRCRAWIVVARTTQDIGLLVAVRVVDVHAGCGSRPALDSHRPGGSRARSRRLTRIGVVF